MCLNKLWVCCLMATILVGCGSGSTGGSSDSSNGSGNSPVSTQTVSGVASKGILMGAVVTIVELDSSGNVLRTVAGPVDTDAQGAYSVILNNSYGGGPIKILVESD